MNTLPPFRRARIPILGSALVIAVYLVSALLVFDVTEPAYKFDEEYNGGTLVAVGPLPRRIFASGWHGDVQFIGDEWPFRVYARSARSGVG